MFWIFCRNLRHGSQNSIQVSRVKIGEKKVFFCFLSRSFSIFEQMFFRLLAKKLQEFVKTTFYVSRGTICGLSFYFKFWNVSDFLQKHLAWFSKFYLRVQSKNCGKNSFFVFFQNFFEFWANFFQTFDPKTSRSWKKTNFCASRGTFCDFNFFF